MKRADLVWISGRSIHPKADLEAQETFKKTSQKK
ncbi:winged helix-turn-helix domain-containing protein [Candidatus Neptunichlamydia sp. REUL1]